MFTGNCDIAIIGSGIAGLSFALHAAELLPQKTILLITKEKMNMSNTDLAQGGIAVVTDPISDSHEKHISDTLIAGDGLCNESVVRMVVSKAQNSLDHLERWGVRFDRNHNGKYHSSREGGHSVHRVLHHKDRTGHEISNRLIQAVLNSPNIQVLENHMAVDLVLERKADGKKCIGFFAFNSINNQMVFIQSGITVLATGGIGALFKRTSNPRLATGDGIAMALRANIEVSGMEFVQFHPTVLHNNSGVEATLVTEALRGFGAILRNKQGEAFMARYDERKDLASRDIVSRAIMAEMEKDQSSFVYLDCRELNPIELRLQFPGFVAACEGMQLNLEQDLVPVYPAAHYLCGGIKVDEFGQTDCDMLFALGECANTGLHGANRLASNSLLEALVFAEQAAHKCAALIADYMPLSFKPNEFWSSFALPNNAYQKSKENLQSIMQNYAGIIRSAPMLKSSLRTVEKLQTEMELAYLLYIPNKQLLELRNMCKVAEAILSASLERNNNKGCFYKTEALV